jgi:hypothetical protein
MIAGIPPEPKRVLQHFDREAQEAYRHWTAKQRLDWLADINELYWSARNSLNPIVADGDSQSK